MILGYFKDYIDHERFRKAVKRVAETRGLELRVETLNPGITKIDLLEQGNKKYRIGQKEESEHVYGKGGYRIKSSVLYSVVDNSQLIESRQHTEWDTPSDESEGEQETKNKKFTALYSADDDFAKALFEELKRKFKGPTEKDYAGIKPQIVLT
ncbi:MAG: hypothetical protein Q8N99_01105 [Nanoarchaeota archaeon]|nr:hypothetical protein [Nanoarchaeota archaeon]